MNPAYLHRCPCCRARRKRWGHGQGSRRGQPSDRGRWVRVENDGPRLICAHCARRIALLVAVCLLQGPMTPFEAERSIQPCG